jgi:hypothetical protein
MRQGNPSNNKRMRGRNRKGPNPLTRSYESNGPDVKIRGTALHIAEKYGQLARDAQSSGDRVAAENYYQHAEHYYRIIAAAQAQMPFPQQQQVYRNDDGDEEGEEHGMLPQQPPQPNPQYQPARPEQFRREGGEPGHAADNQPSFGNNGHNGPAPGTGDQPTLAEGEMDDDEGLDAAPQPNGGGGGQPQQHGQFRRRRRPHRGGRPDNRDGNYNPGPASGGSDD